MYQQERISPKSSLICLEFICLKKPIYYKVKAGFFSEVTSPKSRGVGRYDIVVGHIIKSLLEKWCGTML